MYRILLVEDVEECRDLVYKALNNNDFIIEWSPTVATSWDILKQRAFDLIILDVGLPDGDGFQFYSMLQREEFCKDIPVVFLTAQDDVSQRILGFSLGADDYIVKPFHPVEFRTRIDSRLKKTGKLKTRASTLRCGDITLHVPSQRAFVDDRGKKTDLGLTALEFKILYHLMNHEDQIFSREQILDAAWGDGTHLSDRTIDTHIYSLRRKMGTQATKIEAVYGQGYRFTLSALAKKLAA